MAQTTSQSRQQPAEHLGPSEQLSEAVLRVARWDALDQTIEAQTWLDKIADPLQKAVYKALTPGPVGTVLRNVLDGSFLGHPLHAAVTDVPIGSWTASLVLDLISARRGNRKLDEAADIIVGVGILGALSSAITGLADWSYTRGAQRRLGVAHALTNTTVAGLYTASFLSRRAGNRRLGRSLSYVGYGLLMFGAFLGGELAYRFGIGVDHSAFEQAPAKWVDVQGVAAVGEGELRGGMAAGMPVLLTRRRGQIYAIGDTCTHMGCLLSKGTLNGDIVTCYCHQSQFNVTTGQLVRGPADYPEPRLEVREADGRIEVRREGRKGEGSTQGGAQTQAKRTTQGAGKQQTAQTR